MMTAGRAQYLRGVNLSGAEFGEGQIPGTFNRDYTYNSENSFRYFAAKNLGLIRLPVRWERLQPAPSGPLDANNLSLLKGDIAWASAHGAKVIVDIHNYGRYRMNESGKLNEYVIDNVYGGVTKVSRADLADFWGRMAKEFRDEAAVYAYDLINEPHDMGSADWKAISQAAVMAIRVNGDNKLIMVPGNNWSAANTWPAIHGPTSWITDPANNFVYEAHQYFDSDNSGGYKLSYDDELKKNPNLATIGVTRLTPFLDWCRNNNVRGYLGEYGIPDTDSRWMTVLDNFLTSLDAAGFDGTYWAAGEWWGAYPLSVQPQNNFTVDRPQIAVLGRHLPPLSMTTLPAGSFSGAILAPDSLAVAFFSQAAPANSDAQIEITASTGVVTAAQVLYADSSQINYVVPGALAPGHYDLAAKSGGAVVGRGILELDAVAPSLFAANGNGRGVAAAQIIRVRADGSQTYEPVAMYDTAQGQFVAQPIDFGSTSDRLFLILYGTGWRSVSDPGRVTLLIGPALIPVQFAGKQPDFVGLDQINTELPRSLAGTGQVTVSVTVDGKPANPLTLAFK